MKRIFLLLLFLSNITFAQTFTAQVEQTTVALGDTIQLILAIDADLPNDNPDLLPLTNAFDIVATAKSTQLTIINNQNMAKTQWVISLAPKLAGTLTIPAISLGKSQTQPITVTVTQTANNTTKNTSSAKADADNQKSGAFLQAEISPKVAYPQSQAIYTVKLFYQDNLQSGSLTDPAAPDLKILKLGNDITYHTKYQGQRYRVIERRYALFPQKSGLITIKPVIFLGELLNLSQDINDIEQFFNSPARTIRLTSPTLQLNVQAQPTIAHNQWWLPAHSFKLTETWNNSSSEIHLGEPLVRTIVMEASGVEPTQLPDISASNTEQLNSYPDKATTETTFQDPWLVTTRTVKIAYVPGQSGKTIISPLQIPWFNTQTNKFEMATLPARNINILSDKNSPSHQQTVAPTTTSSVTKKYSGESNPSAFNWQWLALFFLFAWIATLCFWVFQKCYARYFSKSFSNSLIRIRNRIKQACAKNDAVLAKENLIAFAACIWPEKKIISLGELAAMISSDTLKAAIIELEKFLYTDHSAPWQGNALWQAFSKCKISKARKEKESDGPLPKLYL